MSQEMPESSMESDTAAAIIEENTTENIRNRFNDLQNKKIALLASVLALLVGVLGAAGKAPWDMATLNTAAFFVFACGGVFPGLVSVFSRTEESLPRLKKGANTLPPDLLARLRWILAHDERVRTSKKLQVESSNYWNWVKVLIATTLVAILLIVLQFIFPERNNHEQRPITEGNPRAFCQAQAVCSRGAGQPTPDLPHHRGYARDLF